jgi:hypothetical protein
MLYCCPTCAVGLTITVISLHAAACMLHDFDRLCHRLLAHPCFLPTHPLPIPSITNLPVKSLIYSPTLTPYHSIR